MAASKRRGSSTNKGSSDGGGSSAAAAAPESATATSRMDERESRQKEGMKMFGVTVLMMVGSIAAAVLYLAHRLGWAAMLPLSMRSLSFDSRDEVVDVIKGHSFLFVGGPHRGGTTLLWSCLKEHESVSGFSDKVGADKSEGMFTQSVMPLFGIGQERMSSGGVGGMIADSRGAPKMNRRLAQGLGRFGFDVLNNLLEDDPRLTDANQETLLGEWGYLWDFEKPILLEKSPPNMLTSRFLQRMFSPDVSSPDWSPASTQASFLFITRHPIANALAISNWVPARNPRIDLFEKVLHWVITHETLENDRKHLKRSMLIRLEDFSETPDLILGDIHRWMGVRPLPTPVKVQPNPNQKYKKQYCDGLESPIARARHQRMVDKLNARVIALGYDLTDWDCT